MPVKEARSSAVCSLPKSLGRKVAGAAAWLPLMVACGGDPAEAPLIAPGGGGGPLPNGAGASVVGSTGGSGSLPSGAGSTGDPDPSDGAAVAGMGGSEVEAPMAGGAGSETSPDVPAEPSTAPETVSPPVRARAWRLTHEQYSRSVEELTGLNPDLTLFTPETGNTKFVNFSSTGFVRVDLAANYATQAEAIAFAMSRTQLASLTSCDLDRACSDTFVEELARRAFRGTFSETTLAPYRALFASVAEGTEEEAFRAVLATMLNSPLFLYRKELGSEALESDNEFTLTSPEIAELLSFSLLDAPPPPWLAEQAARQELTGLEQQVAAALALLEDPRADEQLGNFLSQWLEIHDFERVEKSDVFPGFDAVRESMKAEALAFFSRSGSQEGTLQTLLLDPVPEAPPALASFYLSDPSAPTAGERLGVLGLGSVMASHAKSYLTSPTQRGLFVRARFFCQEITLPPDFTPPPLSATEELGIARTTRELYERHQADPQCDACHKLTDNIGFALEAFDGAGRLRTLDSTQGEPTALNLVADLTNSDVDRQLTSAADLSRALAESAEVRQCLARQAFRFYFGQGESQGGSTAVTAATERLASDGRLGQLLVGLFASAATAEREREHLE